jgi:zinc transport system substrate-binding protein
LVEFVMKAEEAGARAIFVQPQFPRESADRIGKDIGAEVIVVDPLSRDWLEGTRRMARELARTLAP